MDKEQMETVQAIQDFIQARLMDEGFSVQEIYNAVPYSKRHIDRIFKELTGKTPVDYLRAARLTEGAKRLLEQRQNVVDVAITSGFDSHEGFTRAFARSFRVRPGEYRKNPGPIPLFVQYPVRSYYTYLYHKEKFQMDKNTAFCMITEVSRPARKLLLLRCKSSTDYWSFCEEMGCGWEGLLNSIPEKFDSAALVELPKSLVTPGTTSAAAAVEVPADYAPAKLPDGYDLICLPPCTMLYFQTEKFEEEDDFGKAIDAVMNAIDRYDAAAYGYAYDFETAPKFNFGASTAMGAKMALPVKKAVR